MKTEHNYLMNPMIRKLSRINETASSDTDAASYRGIAQKTLFFMIWAVIGIILFFVLRPSLTGGEAIDIGNDMRIFPKEAMFFTIALILSIIAPLLAFAIKPLVPVLGSIYCMCFSYSFACLGDLLADTYDGIIVAAAVITIILIAVMTIIYFSGLIHITHKFMTVISTLFFTAVLSGILIAVMSLIPGLRSVFDFFRNNTLLAAALSVIYIIIACMFLLVDFQTIKECVENKLPKKYEWIGAFGLAYTIFYLFMQVFNLLSKIQNSEKSKK